MELAREVTIEDGRLQAFCVVRGIRRLGLFGSALRDELRPDSDIDLLVEFEADRTPGMLGIAQLEIELGEMVGRSVDLQTPGELSQCLRDEVAA